MLSGLGLEADGGRKLEVNEDFRAAKGLLREGEPSRFPRAFFFLLCFLAFVFGVLFSHVDEKFSQARRLSFITEEGWDHRRVGLASARWAICVACPAFVFCFSASIPSRHFRRQKPGLSLLVGFCQEGSGSRPRETEALPWETSVLPFSQRPSPHLASPTSPHVTCPDLSLAPQALLLALGIKAKRLGAAAAMSWVLKDALGKFGRILWASKMGRRFDSDAKRWRFRSRCSFYHTLAAFVISCRLKRLLYRTCPGCVTSAPFDRRPAVGPRGFAVGCFFISFRS